MASVLRCSVKEIFRDLVERESQAIETTVTMVQRGQVRLRVWGLDRPDGLHFRVWRNTDDDANVLLQGPTKAILLFIEQIITLFPRHPGEPILIDWTPFEVPDGRNLMTLSEVRASTYLQTPQNREVLLALHTRRRPSV